MKNKKIEIYYSDSISIIILDEYGRDTLYTSQKKN